MSNCESFTIVDGGEDAVLLVPVYLGSELARIEERYVYLFLCNAPMLRNLTALSTARMLNLRRLDPTVFKDPRRPIRRRLDAQRVGEVLIVALQNLDFIPVGARPKAGEELSRTLPAPKEISRDCANETGLIISMA